MGVLRRDHSPEHRGCCYAEGGKMDVVSSRNNFVTNHSVGFVLRRTFYRHHPVDSENPYPTLYPDGSHITPMLALLQGKYAVDL